MSEDEVTLRLTKSQALVLFELLARTGTGPALTYEDQAEQDVLWALEAQLESALTEPLAPNYRQLLEEARRRVKGQSE